jgi:DNA-binding NarL/FixJ family response regulator
MLAGGCPMSPQVARRMTEWFHTRELSLPQVPELLSAREEEILEHLDAGAQNHEIATALRLSEATVCAHLRRLYQKLHVHSRAQAVARRKRRRKQP